MKQEQNTTAAQYKDEVLRQWKERDSKLFAVKYLYELKLGLSLRESKDLVDRWILQDAADVHITLNDQLRDENEQLRRDKDALLERLELVCSQLRSVRFAKTVNTMKELAEMTLESIEAAIAKHQTKV